MVFASFAGLEAKKADFSLLPQHAPFVFHSPYLSLTAVCPVFDFFPKLDSLPAEKRSIPHSTAYYAL